jgi:nitrate/nitrite transport system substrate-binding protein
MLFHNGGFVNLPRKAHGIWFMTQYMRFGYLNQAPDYEAIANKLILTDLYKEVASEMSIPVPDDDMASFTVDLDQFAFDPRNPAASLSRQLLPA